MREYIADGLLLGAFGLACVAGGAGAAQHDTAAIVGGVCVAAFATPLIIRSMAADHPDRKSTPPRDGGRV